MATKKSKYYVVWKGRVPWIYTDRSDCKIQVDGFLWAQYKSFTDKQSALLAYENNMIWQKWQYDLAHLRLLMGLDFDCSVSTDAACPSNPGPIEYRWVIVSTGEEIFSIWPLMWWSTNLAEFLGIVHGLAWLKKNPQYNVLYTDSKIAMNWVQQNRINTKIIFDENNKELAELIDRARHWLSNNSDRPSTISLKKRPTSRWWQIPADFGRK